MTYLVLVIPIYHLGIDYHNVISIIYVILLLCYVHTNVMFLKDSQNAGCKNILCPVYISYKLSILAFLI